MKIYIAGKITGDKNYRQKFRQAQERLEREGHVVLNPAVLPEGMTRLDYMRICFAMIDCADEVAFLPDWTKSKGAQLEKRYCQYVGKSMFVMEGMKDG